MIEPPIILPIVTGTRLPTNFSHVRAGKSGAVLPIDAQKESEAPAWIARYQYH
jgi:hypothetical protein